MQTLQTDLIYRTAGIDDLQALRSLGLLAYGQFKKELDDASWKKMESGLSYEDTYRQLLNSGTCFVCEHSGTIIGMAFVILHGHPVQFFEAGWSYIRLVGVNPSYEGKGIGRALTKMCIAHAKAAGEKTMALHTSEMQHAARHIYESMGFAKQKEFGHLGKRYWIYTLNLTAYDK